MSEKTAHRILVVMLMVLPFIFYGSIRMWEAYVGGIAKDVIQETVKEECLK